MVHVLYHFISEAARVCAFTTNAISQPFHQSLVKTSEKGLISALWMRVSGSREGEGTP